MRPPNPSEPNHTLLIATICILIVILSIIGFLLWSGKDSKPVIKAEAVPIPVKNQPVIRFSNTEKDAAQNAMMKQRKSKFGMDKGVDIIVKSGESIQVGEITVSMKEIIEKIRLKQGDIIEKDIIPAGNGNTLPAGELQAVYGIYMAKPGDNIWNIHFNFLKDYFKHKGVTLSPMADEPDKKGFSSGIGKLLKFSERMVFIYNMKERKIAANLDIITPLTKLVVYNMGQIYKLLDRIDYDRVNHIQFDGETLWIPAEQ